jgi:hypothetical protein
MKHFVMLYRQTPKQLSDQDQSRRAAEVRAWAVRMNREGHRLDGRILQEEARMIAPLDDASRQPNGDPVIAISFVDARDFEEAISIAQSHPGLKYGVAIEVRAWSAPPPPSTASK